MRFITGFLIIFLTISSANACTRILYAQAGLPVLVGNNMDWYEDMNTKLIVYPEGIKRNGMVNGEQLSWTSKYASLVAAAYESVTTNGVNERGLAAHFLGLQEADYGERDNKIPGLLILYWAQFYLDNFQTVAEAVKYTQTHAFQIVNFTHPKVGKLYQHLALEDASGDSAIIEYIDGKPQIYHDRQNTVLTNSPTYDKQIENLKQYSGFGGTKPLPGTTFPADRFVRATYYLNHLPEAKTEREAIFNMFSVLYNATQPFGVPSPERTEEGHIFHPIWKSITDLTNQKFYFNSATSFDVFWVKLGNFDLRPGAPIMVLDVPEHKDFIGEVSKEFQAQS